MSDDIYWDWRETPFKVGDTIKVGDDPEQVGIAESITDCDGDVDDDTGQGYMNPPNLTVRFKDGETDHFASHNNTPAPEWYDPEPQFIWQFDDVEVVKDEDTAPWRSATGDRP